MTSSIVEKSTNVVNQGQNYLLELLAEFEVKTAAMATDFLSPLRRNAAYRIDKEEVPFPTTHHEEWRFTDLSELYQIRFDPRPRSTTILSDTLAPFILPEAKLSSLIFVNGEFAPELSNLAALPDGVYVGNLMGLSSEKREKVVNYLAKHDGAKDVFTLMNTADMYHIAIVWVDPNVTVDIPIFLLFLTVASHIHNIIQPRVLVIAETGSSLQLVEHYGAISEDCSDLAHNKAYFTNTVTEIWVKDNAQVNHTRVQRELGDSFHIGKTAIAQSQDSRYTCTEINLGAKLSRHTLEVFQHGKQTETYLNGLTMVGGKQVADTHSAVFLNHSYGMAHQLHKCIIDDEARGVFNGKIFVPKAAQLTNATQLNRNLLLSPKARINTKPELQITADNVKCSHGATISQLESDELFYLQSRGLTESDARNLLIDAFAAEILDKIPLASLRTRLSQCVACRTT
ncbi:FeS assembly protein SufD [Rippkaea orientalis PCC 8801]|uniref:FeS assembly protein SufD n=1 Tax=Rippkaea orientalis (strain PCC 8801 / RF-1) TaxID=41431 RepID=B7JUD4_RIPO1|nr:Fe-S cluster assembly protein SufD [Rippkaea orientalis]ACK64514.1 FeS assembly protein SufD [Rippkaea orientalis PCC 8801]